ncbi:MAG: hypothetical protein DRO88_02575 [Promethearchaeia archaeon]|nr:MAG: hypothetical protein DRO88_02575 [Candidatus Lokiarchaeia archaeon]
MGTEYKKNYDDRAYKILTKPLASELDLCLEFNISEETLEKWKSESPSFLWSIQKGLLQGEQKLRKIIFSLAFCPPKDSNTKLLTLLASNVYGINEEHVTTIRDQTSVENPEEIMKVRGIPIPDIEVPDVSI